LQSGGIARAMCEAMGLPTVARFHQREGMISMAFISLMKRMSFD
jgi:hypothetical protein